jgi:hypothetical protein
VANIDGVACGCFGAAARATTQVLTANAQSTVMKRAAKSIHPIERRILAQAFERRDTSSARMRGRR